MGDRVQVGDTRYDPITRCFTGRQHLFFLLRLSVKLTLQTLEMVRFRPNETGRVTLGPLL